MNKNYNEIYLLNMQLLATIGFIISLIISYLLSYDKKLSLEKKQRLFSNNIAQNLSLIQSLLIFFISIVFLYINYSRYQLSKTNKKIDFLLQIETSILALISSFIGIYLVIKNNNKNLSFKEFEI